VASMSVDETIRTWREEILGYLEQMYDFSKLRDPKEILIKLAAFSVRARYMSNVSASTDNRKLKDFRYEEIIPFLQETEFQRQTWSRVGTLIKDEWDMARG
jgi:hypothetical protein